LVSRKGNTYRSFPGLSDQLVKLGREAVLDGEIVILDTAGKSQFYELMRRRGQPLFYAFDCLAIDGEDLRELPLIERKQRLKSLVTDLGCILFAEHVDAEGESFFQLICERDLEGVVAKRRDAPYGEGWLKIRNPKYTQYEGRRELFDKKR